LNLVVGIDLHSYLSAMAYPYTRSRARSEVPDSHVEPNDTAPSAATSPPPSIFVGPHLEAVEGSQSVSAESAGPVSAPTLSLPVGGPPSSGSHGVLGSAGPSLVGVSALGYPSGQADPPDSCIYTGGQMSTSLVTGMSGSSCTTWAVVIVVFYFFAAAAGHRQCRTAAAWRSYKCIWPRLCCQRLGFNIYKAENMNGHRSIFTLWPTIDFMIWEYARQR